jgi:hypothetical protein
MNRRGIILQKRNMIIKGGNLKQSPNTTTNLVNNPIFGVATQPPIAKDGSFLGGSVADIKFNNKKRKQNIKFIL